MTPILLLNKDPAIARALGGNGGVWHKEVQHKAVAEYAAIGVKRIGVVDGKILHCAFLLVFKQY